MAFVLFFIFSIHPKINQIYPHTHTHTQIAEVKISVINHKTRRGNRFFSVPQVVDFAHIHIAMNFQLF